MQTKKIVVRASMMVVTGVFAVGLVATAVRADESKAVYEKQCASCHGAGGKGDGPAGKFLKPPLTDFATALKGRTDADIAKAIKEGGKAVGKSAAMPAFGSRLSDDQINGLVAYIKGL